MAALRYRLASTPADYARAASELDRGRGPFAIDTERASAYRYDDRAFLVQIYRRGAGTFLFAPEGYRSELESILGPVVNGNDWIVHAAPEDLPSLVELGLWPGRLFDTALAGRLAGFDRPNLAAMVAEFCGVQLEKGHGREDWSEVPLPEEWLRYAAEDVIYLPDLAEAQAELLDQQGKTGASEQEFCHIVRSFSPDSWAPPERTWRDQKGLSGLRSPLQLAIARELWTERDTQARSADTSPSRILPSRVILDVAKAQPRDERELEATKGFPRRRRGAAQQWMRVLNRVYRADASTWPARYRDAEDASHAAPPGKSAWQRHHPESWEILQIMRSAVAEAASDLNIAPEILLTPAILRHAVWLLADESAPDTHSVAHVLTALGARPWQVAEVAPLFHANLK